MPETTEAGASASFAKGFLLQFVNVKIYLFGITALTLLECVWSILRT